jgi:hypothetical protein
VSLGPALRVELDLPDDPLDGLALGQVGLHETMEQRIVLPGGVAEPAVAPGRSDLAAADRDAHELADRVDRGGRSCAGLDRDALTEPCDSGDHLFAGQTDEGVGAEDRRIIAIEVRGVGRLAHRSAIPPSTTSTCPVA